jgi:hypothetical protein
MNERPSRAKNLTYAALAAQAGCVNLLLVFSALFVGLWLDAQFGVRGPFTIGLLVLSVPIGLVLMLRIALGAIRRMRPNPPPERSLQQETTLSDHTRHEGG